MGENDSNVMGNGSLNDEYEQNVWVLVYSFSKGGVGVGAWVICCSLPWDCRVEPLVFILLISWLC